MITNKMIDKYMTLAQQTTSKADVLKGKEKENQYRVALGMLRSAYNWSEGDQKCFKELHRLGRFVHDHFRCILGFKDNQYVQECPVALSHIPYGFSIAGETTEICSICRKDPLECIHIPGDKYDGVVCIKDTGTCNVCCENKCEHIAGEKYNGVNAFSIVTEISLAHVAIVKNPCVPDARVTSIPIDKNLVTEIIGEIHPPFQWGQHLFCHHCVECNGLIEDDKK